MFLLNQNDSNGKFTYFSKGLWKQVNDTKLGNKTRNNYKDHTKPYLPQLTFYTRPIYIGKNQNPKNLGFLLYCLHCQKNP